MCTIYEDLRKCCKRVIDENLQTTHMLNVKNFRSEYYYQIQNQKGLKFYKYFKPTYHAIRNFEADVLMCNNPQSFNDVFEGMVASGDLDSHEIRSAIKVISNAVSISCFSEVWDNLLMYAHYADSFKGFCIEYSFDYIERWNLKTCFFPVLYQPKPSTLAQILKLKEDVEKIRKTKKEGGINLVKDDDVISYFIHKADIWNYEKEWRYIIPMSRFNQFFDDDDAEAERHFISNFDCVSAVYLAPNIETIYKKHICEIVKRKNEKRNIDGGWKKPITVYQTKIMEKAYKLEVAEQLI